MANNPERLRNDSGVNYKEMELLRTDPIDIMYFDLCRTPFEDGIFHMDFETNFELYPDGKFALRKRNNERPFPYYAGAFTFENDVLTVNVEKKEYVFTLKSIKHPLWLFDYQGKEFCLFLKFDSYTFDKEHGRL